MPQHSASVCILTSVYTVHSYEYCPAGVRQPRVLEILEAFSLPVQVEGTRMQLELALWLGSFLKLGKMWYTDTGRGEGEEEFSVVTAVLPPEAFP